VGTIASAKSTCQQAVRNWRDPDSNRGHLEFRFSWTSDAGPSGLAERTSVDAKDTVALGRKATTERAIDYPVAVDNGYGLSNAFANRYWPALYFVDAVGVIRDHQFGEGR
jgi:hypothetical protein